jgi:hypothetical protein
VTAKSTEFEHLVIDTLDKYPVTVSWLDASQNLMHLRLRTEDSEAEDDGEGDADAGADGVAADSADGDVAPDAEL